jgi:phosphodiesterase/alkaline phosphatase D-like protein
MANPKLTLAEQSEGFITNTLETKAMDFVQGRVMANFPIFMLFDKHEIENYESRSRREHDMLYKHALAELLG